MATVLGQKIRRHRELQALTLEALADKVGSSKSYIWELENKSTTRPSAEKVFKLAKALKVPAEYLIDESKEELADDDRDFVFFAKYKNLDDQEKRLLNKFMDSLSNE